MKIVILDNNFPNHSPETKVLQEAGLKFERLHGNDNTQLKKIGREADVVLVQFSKLTKEILDSWNQCKLIVRYGIGVDNIDVDAATKQGIQVCNVSAYCLDEVADHTTSFILASARKLLTFHQSIQQGIWAVESVARPLPKLSETQVGVIGLGRIGERVLERLLPFGFQVKVYDPFLSHQDAQRKGVKKADDLKTLLSESDIVTLHLPLNKQTHHLINTETLKWMKPTATLVNCSRGALIDTNALANALIDHTIGFAALDVFEQEPLEETHPLRQCSNLLLTPHAAYYSDSSLDELQRLAAEEVVRWARKEVLASPVNHIPLKEEA